jgi:hypothetical protein
MIPVICQHNTMIPIHLLVNLAIRTAKHAMTSVVAKPAIIIPIGHWWTIHVCLMMDTMNPIKMSHRNAPILVLPVLLSRQIARNAKIKSSCWSAILAILAIAISKVVSTALKQAVLPVTHLTSSLMHHFACFLARPENVLCVTTKTLAFAINAFLDMNWFQTNVIIYLFVEIKSSTRLSSAMMVISGIMMAAVAAVK